MKERFDMAKNNVATVSKMDTIHAKQRNMQNLHIPPLMAATTENSSVIRQVSRQIKHHNLAAPL